MGFDCLCWGLVYILVLCRFVLLFVLILVLYLVVGFGVLWLALRFARIFWLCCCWVLEL